MTETSPTTAHQASRIHYGYVIVVAAFFTKLFMWGSNYSFGIFFKPLLVEFGWSRAMTSGAFSLSIIMEGLGSMLMGRLVDRFGPRVVLITCGIVFGLGFVLMSQVTAIWHLYLFYGVVVGLGLSGSFVSTMWAVADWFSQKRGRMMAIVASSLGLGTLIMAPVANWLILDTGWRNAFVIVGLGAMALIVFSALFMKSRPHPSESQPVNPSLTCETATPASVPLQQTLLSFHLWLICASVLLWAFGKYAILVHLPAHMIELGHPATLAATVLAISGGATFVTTIALGLAVDQFGSYRTFTVSLAVMAVALLWLLWIDSLWGLCFFAVVFSFGCACGPILMPSLVVETFGLSHFGQLLGIVNFCACIGCSIGPVLTGYLFDLNGNYTVAFGVLAAMAMLGTLLSVILSRVKGNR